MKVAGSASAYSIIDYLEIDVLRIIFKEAIPLLKDRNYKFLPSDKRDEQTKDLIRATYIEKIDQLDQLGNLIESAKLAKK